MNKWGVTANRTIKAIKKTLSEMKIRQQSAKKLRPEIEREQDREENKIKYGRKKIGSSINRNTLKV